MADGNPSQKINIGIQASVETKSVQTQTSKDDYITSQAMSVPEESTGGRIMNKDLLENVTSKIEDLSLPSSQEDEDSLAQQPPTSGQSDSHLAQLQSPSSVTDSSSSQPPPPSSPTHTLLTQPPSPSSHTDSSLAQQPQCSRPNSKSADEVENVDAVRSMTSNLEESAADESSSSHTDSSLAEPTQSSQPDSKSVEVENFEAVRQRNLEESAVNKPGSSHTDFSLVQEPQSSRTDSKSVEVENAEAVRPQTSKLEELAADESSSSPTDSSLAQPTQSSQPDSKSVDEVESLEESAAEKSDSSHTDPSLVQPTLEELAAAAANRRKEFCDYILDCGPLGGVSDFEIDFGKFFDEFCESFSDITKIGTGFLKLNNDYDRIKYVSRFKKIKKLEIIFKSSKSEFFANQLEEEYNLCSDPETAGLLPRGLHLISRSIQYTPSTNKKGMGIRLMKRAWMNFLLYRYDEAREDALKSLKHHSDLVDMWNTNEVLGYCYAAISYNHTAEDYFDKALSGLRQSNLDNVTKVRYTKRILNVYKCVKGLDDLGNLDEKDTEYIPPRIIYGVNTILKCATDAVEVRVTDKTGRGLYAKKDLKPGDVIIVENPYVSILEKESLETHCYYCYKRLRSPIPCDTCSRVWFCSDECLKKAKAKDGLHSSECSVLSFLYDKSIGSVAVYAFRILSLLTWENIKSLRKNREIDTKLPDLHPLHTEFNFQKKYLSDDYLTTYKLVTNAKKRSFIDLFKRTVSAVYIKQCLKVINFFPEDVSLEDETFVASLILRHLQNVSCNSYSIIESVVGDSCIHDVSFITVGGGIYPTISLINHSCNPNVFRYSIGKACILKASKTITQGEQLFEGYGQLFSIHERESRRELLQSRYMFDCDCIACKENWPLYEDNKVYMKFKCPVGNCMQIVEYDGDKKINCPSCGSQKKHRKLMAEATRKIDGYNEGIEKLKDNCIDEAAVEFKHFQMFADKYVIPPSTCFTQSREMLQRSHCLQGNLYRK